MKKTFLPSVLLGSFILLGLGPGNAQADYVRTTPMFDIPQNQRAAWGTGWCAPTAVGNSLAWLAAEYGLDGLTRVGGTGAVMSAADVVNELGAVDMKTDPTKGTKVASIDQAKKDYIKRHGLEISINVESRVALPKSDAAGEFTGFVGTPPSKQWFRDQFRAGQDVEVAWGYYKVVQKADGNRVLVRTGGHTQVVAGAIPGEELGGHIVSLSNLVDPAENEIDSNFLLTFTDPGRDDLAGQYGALFSEQYSLTDAAGAIYLNTASTYQVLFDPNILGMGFGAYLVDGYTGTSGTDTGNLLAIIEAGWAESPVRRRVPEPSPLALLALGLAGLGFSRCKH